jgi:antibiotic biosynthesis monooxygenase (ABM) superfamily enzyme
MQEMRRQRREDPVPAPDEPAIASPSRHELALMIWIAAFPTLTIVTTVVGDLLAPLPTVVKTLILVTVSVPIVIYGVMPQLFRARRFLILRRRRRTGSDR